MSGLPYLVGAYLILLGIVGMATSRSLVHTIVCLSVTQSGTYVLLLGIGFRHGGTAPVFGDVPAAAGVRVVDPVVQALVLTDVVVNAAVTALLLAIALQLHKRHGTVDPDELSSLRG